MSHITCDKCKNADLVLENEELCCPSCGAHFPAADENLLIGITLYNENKKEECEDALMKALVKDGSSSKALIYKALSDALNLDEDTVSFSDIYARIISAFSTSTDEELPGLIAVANDEMAKHEKALSALHVNAFETADAEKIKKEVEFLLKIRDEALSFRRSLTEFADEFNKKDNGTIALNLSRCFYVSYEQADEIGDKKLNKIKDDIASHTVFTGILSSDIKNLEIYYRCVVMFFEKSKAKYDFLISNAKKLAYLNGALESGKYANVASPAAAAEKLKAAAYSFFEESLKEYDDENEDAPSVTFRAPEIKEEPEETVEETVEEATEEAVEEAVEETVEETGEEAVTEVAEESGEKSAEEVVAEEIEEAVEEAVEEANEASDKAEAPEEHASKSENIDEEAPAEDTPTEEAPVEEAPAEENGASDEAAPSDSEVKEAIEQTVQKVMDEISAESEKAVTELSETTIDISSNSFAKPQKSTVYKAPEATVTEETQVKDAIVELPEDASDEDVTADAAESVKEEPFAEASSESLPEGDIKDEPYETTLKPKKKNRHVGLIMLLIIIIAILSGLGFKYIPGLITEAKYNSAVKLLENGSYSEAHEAFKKLGDYEDAADKVLESDYLSAEKLAENGEYAAAAKAFEALGEYSDAVTRTLACKYDDAVKTLDDGNFDDAARLFEEIKDYGNSEDMIKECTYRKASSLLEGKSYTDASELFASLGDYSDSADKAKEAKYQYVTDHLSKDDKTTVAYITELAKLKYRNSAELKTKLLGEEKNDAVKVFVNTSETDLSTSLKSASHSSKLYFHIVGSEELFGKSITLSYTTQYGYTQSSTVTLSKNSPDDYITYPASNVAGYTVTFNAYNENGETLGKVEFTVE